MSSWTDMSTTKGKIGVATGAVLGVFGVYLVARKIGQKKPLSKKKLIRVFDAISKEMQTAIIEIAQTEKQIRASAQARGQRITNEDIYQFAQETMAKKMSAAEPAVYAQFKTNEAAVKKAARKYKDDPEFSAIVEKMKSFAGMIQPPEEIPSWFTEDKLLDFLREMMEALNVGVEQKAAELKAAGIDPVANKAQFSAKIGMNMQMEMQRVNIELPKKHGITQTIVTAAMQKYQASPRFTKVMNELREEQQARFEAVGVDSN